MVRVKWANFLTQSWPPAEAIFIFGLQRIMPAVDKKVMQYNFKPVNPASTGGSRVKLISFGFQVPGKTAVRRGVGKSPEGVSKAYEEHFVHK